MEDSTLSTAKLIERFDSAVVAESASPSYVDDGDMSKHQAAYKFFHEYLADDRDLAQGFEFAKFLSHEWGFKRDDPRFTKLYDRYTFFFLPSFL